MDWARFARRTGEFLASHWRAGVVIAWLVYALVLLATRQSEIAGLALRDTDDNMRLAQVRAWLDGQGWYDLRQYKMLPPGGADMHWSRIVDLPIAGLILLLTPLLGAVQAEQWAAGIAPLLPMLIMALSLSLVVRRTVDPAAWPLALLTLLSASILTSMYAPLRLDHHGWQIAMMATALAGVTDPRPLRGGLIAGLATAISFNIGLEMILILALLAASIVLGWVVRPAERQRMLGYALAIGGASSLGFLIFASEANRAMRCDALTPVWLADIMLGAAMLFAIGWKDRANWKVRLALAAAAGLSLAAFHALAFPQCLSRLEGVSPEATQLWLNRVNEARSVLSHSLRVQGQTLAVVVVGLIGHAVALVAAMRQPDGERRRVVLITAAASSAAFLLLLWQMRVAPSAQLLAVPGCVALLWLTVPFFLNSRHMLVRVVATPLVAIIGFGALPYVISNYLPRNAVENMRTTAAKAGGQRCQSKIALEGLNSVPPGTLFAPLDLGPRLIVMTHHKVIIGPYHRNDEAIVDVIGAYMKTPAEVRPILARYHADYLLQCWDSRAQRSSRSRRVLTDMLIEKGAPDWLEPVRLPKGSPYLLWRIKPPAPETIR